MTYRWNSNLETGNARVDGQHKMLFEALYRLGNACRTGEGAQELERAFEFLAGYTLKHFADEEELQRQYNYPDYLRHKRYHDDFVGVVRELSAELAQNGYSHALMLTTYATLGEWLVHHIQGEDFRMATYVKPLELRARMQLVTSGTLETGPM